MKKLLAYLLTFAMVISCFAGIKLTAEAEGENELSVGQTIEIAPTGDSSADYYFTPEEDGMYTMYSYDMMQGYFDLFSSETGHLVTAYEDENGAHVITYSMEAGKEYYFSFWNSAEESYFADFIKMENATGIYFAEDTVEGYVGEQFYLDIGFEPVFSLSEHYTLTSDNENVAFFNEYDEIVLAGKGNATITVTTDSGLTDSCVVVAKEPRTLVLDQATTVDDAKEDGAVYFTFTPSKTAFYAFYSDTDLDVYGHIYTSDFSLIAEDDDSGEELNFIVKAELESGVTYILESYLYPGRRAKNYNVYITELKQATEMNFQYDTMTTYIDESFELCVEFGPGIAQEEEFEFTSNNENVVTVSKDEWNNGRVIAVGVGSATITATSENGLVCTCQVTVKEPEVLTLDEEKTVDLADEQNLVSYTFTPDETAQYVFYSTDGNGHSAELYHDGNYLYDDYGSGNGNNFKLVYDLQEGQTYKYVAYFAVGAESLTTMIQKATAATELEMEYDNIYMYVGDMMFTEAIVQPDNAATNITFETSDEDVVAIGYVYNTEVSLEAVSVGTATITATGENGLTATSTITVMPIPSIQLNETKIVNIEDDYQVGTYAFTPEEDGTYVLSTSGAEGVACISVFSEEDGEIAIEHGEDELDVTVEVYLEAGVEYIIRTGFLSRLPGSVRTGSYKLSLYNAANPPVDNPDKDDTTTGGAMDDIANTGKPSSPQTGDTNATWIWITLMTVAVLGALVVVITRKKNK